MSVYADVQSALEQKLATLTDLPMIVNENDIGYKTQNDAYNAQNQKYIRTTLIPARTDTLCLGINGSNRFQGLFQIDIFVPSGNSIEETNYWVDEIIDLFKHTTIINNGTTIRIDNCSRLPGNPTTNLHNVGVVVEWYSIAT